MYFVTCLTPNPQTYFDLPLGATIGNSWITFLETGLTSHGDPRGPIPQNCCGDCWGDCRGKIGVLKGVPEIVPGELPGGLVGGAAGETALALRSRQTADKQQSPRQSPRQLPRHYSRHPSTPIFPGSPPQQSPQQFWGIGPRKSLWLVSPVSIHLFSGSFFL